jgi:hypothetical protein
MRAAYLISIVALLCLGMVPSQTEAVQMCCCYRDQSPTEICEVPYDCPTVSQGCDPADYCIWFAQIDEISDCENECPDFCSGMALLANSMPASFRGGQVKNITLELPRTPIRIRQSCRSRP